MVHTSLHSTCNSQDRPVPWVPMIDTTAYATACHDAMETAVVTNNNDVLVTETTATTATTGENDTAHNSATQPARGEPEVEVNTTCTCVTTRHSQRTLNGQHAL